LPVITNKAGGSLSRVGHKQVGLKVFRSHLASSLCHMVSSINYAKLIGEGSMFCDNSTIFLVIKSVIMGKADERSKKVQTCVTSFMDDSFRVKWKNWFARPHLLHCQYLVTNLESILPNSVFLHFPIFDVKLECL